MVADESLLSGNKGEWSEIYVLLKLLNAGSLYFTDDNDKSKVRCYLIDKIIRNDGLKTIEYSIDENLVAVKINGEKAATIDTDYLESASRQLFIEILNGKNSFALPEFQSILESMDCLFFQSKNKRNPYMSVIMHQKDSITSSQIQFKIMSQIGSAPTVINASRSTNIEYILDGNIDDEIMTAANNYFQSDSSSKIIDGMLYLRTKKIRLMFNKTSNPIFQENLNAIDNKLPSLISDMMLLHYRDGIYRIKKQIDSINQFNRYNDKERTMIEKLLVNYLKGLKTAERWDSREQSDIGIMVVNKDGSLLNYTSADSKEFRNYLINNTKTETPSTKRHDYAYVYKRDGAYYIQLNLQVRLITPSADC